MIHINNYQSTLNYQKLINYKNIFTKNSTNSIITTIKQLITSIKKNTTIITILPDQNDHYLNLIYSNT